MAGVPSCHHPILCGLLRANVSRASCRSYLKASIPDLRPPLLQGRYLSFSDAPLLDIRSGVARTPRRESRLLLVVLHVRTAQTAPGRAWAFWMACFAAILATTSSNC